MPGEPFGIAMSEDGESLVITHQNDTKTSLFSTGLRRTDADTGSGGDGAPRPFLQFILDGVPFGGIGIAAVPHDRDAFLGAPAAFPRAAFLQTSAPSPRWTSFGATPTSSRARSLRTPPTSPVRR